MPVQRSWNALEASLNALGAVAQDLPEHHGQSEVRKAIHDLRSTLYAIKANIDLQERKLAKLLESPKGGDGVSKIPLDKTSETV